MIAAKQQVWGLLLLTLGAFAWRGFIYLALGSTVPAWFFVGVLCCLLIAWLVGQRLWRFMLYVWAFFLMLYGLLRGAIVVLAQAGTIGSAHVVDATSIWFVVTSLAYFGAGIALRSSLRRSLLPKKQSSIS
ncbi:MAG: hypothetical protein AB8F65_11350 [Woeseiaceae bacterium]